MGFQEACVQFLPFFPGKTRQMPGAAEIKPQCGAGQQQTQNARIHRNYFRADAGQQTAGQGSGKAVTDAAKAAGHVVMKREPSGHTVDGHRSDYTRNCLQYGAGQDHTADGKYGTGLKVHQGKAAEHQNACQQQNGMHLQLFDAAYNFTDGHLQGAGCGG